MQMTVYEAEISQILVLLGLAKDPARVVPWMHHYQEHSKSQWEVLWKVCQRELFGSIDTAEVEFLAELEAFKRIAALTETETVEFKLTTIVTLKDFIRGLHEDQERKGNMMYLRRLEPFLVSMEEYCRIVENTEVFVNATDISAYLWVRRDILTRIPQSNYSWVVLGTDEICTESMKNYGTLKPSTSHQNLNADRRHLTRWHPHLSKHWILF